LASGLLVSPFLIECGWVVAGTVSLGGFCEASRRLTTGPSI
jgi:hypothetical protein